MSADNPSDPHEQNRRSWNAVTAAHNSHKRNQVQFLRDGGSTLFPEELELLGDPSGRRLVHLQCNCGQDSISLATLGAQVTGVDISDEAIRFARSLAEESGIPATFVRSDLFDWFDARPGPNAAGDRFDLVYSTYGTIGWIRDLDRWARGVHGALTPGGRLILLEFHPLAFCLDASGRLINAYFAGGPLHETEGVGDYVGRSEDGLTPMGRSRGVPDFENPEPGVAYPWTLAETLSAVAGAGLVIETVREYPYANGCRLFDGMSDLGRRRFGLPAGRPNAPLMFGLTARRGEARP